MKPLFVLAAVVLALTVAAAQDSRPQRFRAGVDLITVDVTAVDAKGHPVEDLKPGDFVVKVDGKPRPTVSAELIKVDRGQPAKAVRPTDALISTNDASENARRIVLAVDQTLITPGMLAPLLKTASQFVDRLAPSDYAAFIGFPEPGPRVDFTTDKPAVRRAMQTLNIGQPAKVQPSLVNISLFEAFTITGAESIQDRDKDLPPGPVMQKVLDRVEEAGLTDLCPPLIGCKPVIFSDSTIIAAEARLQGTISLHALEALLKDLVPLEGPKSMVVFSAGMVSEDPSLLEGVKRLAAAARTTINVIVVDRDLGQLSSQTNPLSSNSLFDRSFELQGLETIADITNGTPFRGVASGAGIFERLEAELSARYLVAVERQPGDPESQRIEVDVKRRGVSVKSNKTVVTGTVNARRPAAELLSDALSSPFALPGIPLRVSTFTQRDASGDKYRVRLAAQIGEPGTPAGEFTLGYVLTNAAGRVVQPPVGSQRTLSPAASGRNQTLQYDTSLTVAPGTYALRFAVVDKDGRRGTVVHRLELPKFDAGVFATSDLIVGNLPAEGESLTPRVEPQVTTSELAGYLELYLPEDGDVSVALEIAEGESSPTLAMGAMAIRPGETPASRVATGFVAATAMSPGRYLARAVVRRNGVTLKTLTRPITIVRDPTVVTRATTRPKGVPITRELQSRTATYVRGVVNGLANVAAQEDFALNKPDRRVTSEMRMVSYPGTQRDLIFYRDVFRVNGTAVAGREERLRDLFEKPTDNLREQARRIMAEAEAYVPWAFNPIWVIAFFQPDLQSRFEFTVSDAGSDWAREVKAVTFVEVGRPTLLRAGVFRDLDAPTRGTAWIEEGTGRILQTELQIGRGGSMPTMVTKFQVDERLQVTVPVEMRTKNPDGVAVYSNFGRFDIRTDTQIPTPPKPQ